MLYESEYSLPRNKLVICSAKRINKKLKERSEKKMKCKKEENFSPEFSYLNATGVKASLEPNKAMLKIEVILNMPE